MIMMLRLAMMMVAIEYAMEWITSPGKDGPRPRIFNNSIAFFFLPGVPEVLIYGGDG